MSSERQISAYNAGARGGAPIGVSAEDMASYRAGLQAHQAGGGGAAGAGSGLLLIPFLLALPVAFVANAIAFSFRGACSFDKTSSLLDRLSLTHVLLVAAAMVGAHFVSRRLDARLGGPAGFFARFRLRRKATTA